MEAVELLEGRETPVEWADWSESERLDWIATRILADDRTDSEVTAHTELRDAYWGYGYLSESQYERRMRREIYWERDLESIDWLDSKVFSGQVFSRKYTTKLNATFTDTLGSVSFTPMHLMFKISDAEYGDGVDPLEYLGEDKPVLEEGDEYPAEYLHWFRKGGR